MNHALYPMTLLYDAACPVCSLEMDHLWERNAAGRLAFVDISAAGFDPSPYGVTLQAMNEEIHAIAADGRVLHGVQVLRLAYEAVGLGWVLKPIGWAPLQPAFELGYRWFARHRQAISRASAPLVRGIRRVRAARMAARMQACRDGACRLHRGE
ncbi:thiol-disulfide oxidoreductase DCC family protein [Rhizobacter sp. P5_C2]